MDWPTWVYARLCDPTLPLAQMISSEVIHASGSLTGRPNQTPFLVIHFGLISPRVGNATEQECTVWVHDEPGDYTQIRNLIKQIRNQLQIDSIVDANAMCSIWTGDSSDLADDGYNTIVRNTNFILIGRE